MAKKINVLVLAGGPSSEREVSLRTGAQVAKALPKDKYRTELFIFKTGAERIPKGFDVAFIGMHGRFGEDGTVQALLEATGLPYTGSGVLASALAMDKAKASALAAAQGIRTPKRIVFTKLPTAKERTAIKIPCVVKPNASGSSIGVAVVHRKKDLGPALRRAFREDRTVLVEEYIRGTELTCGVMGNTGRTPLAVLPPIEIVPARDFFDYRAKYADARTKEICPARVNAAVRQRVARDAVRAHAALGCDGLTRADFILDRRGRLYFLEINTIPGLTETSLLPRIVDRIGMTFPGFLDRQIALALEKRRRPRRR